MTKRYTFSLAILLCILSSTLFAQQLPLLHQFRESSLYVNPANISSDYFQTGLSYSAGATYRYQWTDVEGAPRTMMARVEQYAPEKKMTWGAYIINDETGPTSFTSAYFRGGYVIEMDNEMLLSFGLAAGLAQYRVKGSELFFLEPDDIAKVDFVKIVPDISLGAYLYSPGNYYFGLSMPQTLGIDLTYKNEVRDFNIQRVQHIFGNAGFFVHINDRDFFEISSWGKYVGGAPFNADFNVKYQHGTGFWVGAGWSTANSLRADFGVTLLGGKYETDNMLKVAYAYDYNFSKVGPFFGSAHEINLSYAWGWGY
jgi:type IX secretion system PorP/SprF family membrane protein